MPTLAQNNTFTWKFTEKNNTQEFGGKFTIEGNIVALERKEGGSLIAEVIFDGEKKFNFRMLGAPDSDKGLDFSR